MNRTSKPARKPVAQKMPSCAVTIDHTTYLFPFAAGQKVLELMAKAVRVDLGFSDRHHRYTYRMREGAPHLEMTVVMPDQVLMPVPQACDPDGGAPLQLGHNGSRS